MTKLFSQACENNKAPILAVLKEVLIDSGTVLEIGSGTGQHAVYMAKHLRHINWQPSDLPANLPSIQGWTMEARLPNVLDSIVFDVAKKPWPISSANAVFSANTAHIMSWPEVCCMIKGIGEILVENGYFFLYGPFNYKGHYTSASNERFDQYLRTVNPAQGIRDFEDLEILAKKAGLKFHRDQAMPANNRTLVWRKVYNHAPNTI